MSLPGMLEASMIATVDRLFKVAKTALLKFSNTHPEPCHGDLAGWALWYEARRMYMLDAARRYDVDSLEYGELFVMAHHSVKQACELWESYNQATNSGQLRLVCDNGHVHGPLARGAESKTVKQPLAEKVAR